jgi:ABC-type multidrug transport system ATPase subunit
LGGQKRKLCVPLSLLGALPIVVMDEPIAGFSA